ncbi:MAG TPA: DUF2249 domain-containing protein [Longimicrobium sp.]
MVIRAEDRVSRVLAQDEGLVDVLAAASPHFERLRSPAMRRVMARLVTVGQAARIAGVPVDELLARLNAAAAGPPTASNESNEVKEMTTEERTAEGMPPALAGVPEARVVDLDVRDALRRGEEPFSRIMAARQALPRGHVLRLRAIFEPAPLYAVMGKQGFLHWTETLAPDDWRVWFYRADEAPARAASAPVDGGDAAEDAGEGVVVLDVRGLDPPEPMARTLAALETLPEGATLVQLNVRTPQFLLPRLDEAGWQYEVREQGDELVRVFIRRRAER